MSNESNQAGIGWAELVNALQVGVIITDKHSVIRYINNTAAEIFQRECSNLIGTSFGFPLSRNEVTEIEIIHSDQTVTIAEIHIHKGFWLDEKSWIITIQDITERTHKDEALEIAARVFSSSSESIIITDMSGCMIDVNASFERTFGYKKEEAIGKNVSLIKSGRHPKDFDKYMFRTLKKKGNWQGELWDKRKDGRLIPIFLNINLIKNVNNEPVFYVGLLHDMSLIKKHEQELLHLAHFDSLTGLYNLNFLTLEIEKCIKDYKTSGTSFSLAYIDIDRFQDINKQFGTSVGDKVLKKFGLKLKRFIHSRGLTARVSGNTFAMIINKNPDEESIHVFLEKLHKFITKKIKINKKEMSLSCSIGYLIYPVEDNASSGQVIRQAESAMIESKIRGGNRKTAYNIDEVIEQRHRHHIINEVNHGINAGEFVVFYQPKVNMRTSHVSGAEALIRWQHPLQGLCLPGYFLPYLEGNEAMSRLSCFIFDEVFRQLDEWLNKGIDLSISINVSAHDLQNENFFQLIKEKLMQYHNRLNKHIELELLESAAVYDIKKVSEIINNFHDIDIRVSLDDFGTGYSSLSYLRTLQVDTIKIDKSFINEMLNSPKVIAILDSILNMARRFNQSVIAEGIDSLEKGVLLLQLGCVEGQGYFIGKPMPAADFIRWTGSWASPPEWKQQKAVYQENIDLIYARSFINWAINQLTRQNKITSRQMVTLESSLKNLALSVSQGALPDCEKTKADLGRLIHDFSQLCHRLNSPQKGLINRDNELDMVAKCGFSLQKLIDLLR